MQFNIHPHLDPAPKDRSSAEFKAWQKQAHEKCEELAERLEGWMKDHDISYTSVSAAFTYAAISGITEDVAEKIDSAPELRDVVSYADNFATPKLKPL